MADLLKLINLEKWWMTVLTVGLSFVFIAFTVEIKVLDNKRLLILGSGLALFGLGRKMCAANAISYKPANIYTGPAARITRSVYRWDIIGTPLMIVGAGLFVWFVKLLIPA